MSDFLFDWQPKGIMSLEEMRTHEWVVPWSGGKDSTATILLMIKHNIPIKRIFNVRMMYDENTPAVLPLMTDFVDYAAKYFRENYGLQVDIVKSLTNFKDIVTHTWDRAKYEHLNGKQWGFYEVTRGVCAFQPVKMRTQQSVTGKDDYIMLGYGCDEMERFSHDELTEAGFDFKLDTLNEHKQSLLFTLQMTEAQAMLLCEHEGLLSPHYAAGITRDGCWFCPNAGFGQRRQVMTKYPELYKKIEECYKLNLPLHQTEVYDVKNTWCHHFNQKYKADLTSLDDYKKENKYEVNVVFEKAYDHKEQELINLN